MIGNLLRVARSVRRIYLLKSFGIGGTLLLLTLSTPLLAQNRLAKTAEYERYRTQSRNLSLTVGSASAGTLNGSWAPDGKAFFYRKDGKLYRFDLTTRQNSETQEAPPDGANPFTRFNGGGFLERGRQATVTTSPDGRWKAEYREGNIELRETMGNSAKQSEPKKITTDGGKQNRLFYGTASWVYGEELEQRSAMWWSPDSKKLAYYRFDESNVKDYYVALDQLEVQDRLDAEPYPKAGAANPIVDLYIYDIEKGQNVRVDVRDGKPFTNDAIGHYVYNIRWSPDGKELLFYRTNRLQNILEFAAADPASGRCRTILQESWPTTWTTNLPIIQFLKDGKRFVWGSDRTGFRNLYLYDLSGKLIAPLTNLKYDVDQLLRVDENGMRTNTGRPFKEWIYYTAHDGDNPMKIQLHRVDLNGMLDSRLTDPKWNHRVNISPDGRFFLDIAQTHDLPPFTRLMAVTSDPASPATPLITLAESDIKKLQTAGMEAAIPELLTFKGGDGKTDVYGMLFKPSNFDPKRKYPLLVSVYAGPETPQAEMVNENFFRPHGFTEMGFLVAVFDGRGTTRRGKAYLDAIYGKLGQMEIDDQAAGVKYLSQRPYVDSNHVGVYGTSYGGYASLMCLLRYPDVFHAASASSAVTDWRNYDSIYTERFMGLPQQNREGYTAGAAATYAQNMKGKLLIYFGTADNNVHPSNTLQFLTALDRAGKDYELRVGTDAGHSGVNQGRMLEFFVENLMPGVIK